MTREAARRGPLDGRALPQSDRVSARALGPATRFILRGGADVVAPASAALGLALPTKPLTSASAGARAALWLGPDEWLLIDDSGDEGWPAGLAAALAGVFHALVDVSHRQSGLELTGPGAARALGAGVPLDLDIEAFPVGMATRTLLIKAEITLWRVEAERFRVETTRSFAPYVAAVLTTAARDLAQG